MKVTEVVAALIWDKDKFMICQRPANKARGLLWEFVGGKVEPNESKKDALIRECIEELDIKVDVFESYMEVLHQYPDLLVNLTLFNCKIAQGTPKLLEHNDLKWITVNEIDDYDFCPADEEILKRLKMEERKYLTTTIDNKDIYKYTITDGTIKVSVINYGADITNIILPNGKDVVLGYEDVTRYFDNGPHLGSTIFPNGNRIAKGDLEIDGKKYNLVINNNGNNLHSHKLCDRRIYEIKTFESNKVVMETIAKNEDDYFPGNRVFTVSFTVENSALVIDYQCISDAKTVFNPTQHSYFNLNGHDKGTVLNHEVVLNCDYITETDSNLIPNGNLLDIRNTAMDFTVAKKLSKDIKADYLPLVYGNGYDHNYCINEYDGTIRFAGALRNDETIMSIYTDMPGIQMYTGNFLNEEGGKNGAVYKSYEAVALETQYYPDSVHHDNFPSSIIEPNKVVKHTTIYKFEKK